jgi:exopolysaccharide biosynthesis polyprenyl glycosylphosphotransferase
MPPLTQSKLAKDVALKTNFNRSLTAPPLPLPRTASPRTASPHVVVRPAGVVPHRVALPSRAALAINRALDVTFAVGLLVLCAVPMLVIAAMIKFTSRGPVIFRQERTGLRGRTFVMYKFRTMWVDAESATGPIWSKPGDTRCTPLGAILRRYSVDELPQLFNVVKGDMSLVGPRPERPYFVEKFSREHTSYSERLAVLPGITGWAQINGWRGNTSLEKRIECDLFYIRHWSVLFNIRILLKTPLRAIIDDHGC